MKSHTGFLSNGDCIQEEYANEFLKYLQPRTFCIKLTLVFVAGDHGHSISPVTPSELLVALHNIDCSNDEALMKSAIKGCFSPFLLVLLFTINLL